MVAVESMMNVNTFEEQKRIREYKIFYDRVVSKIQWLQRQINVKNCKNCKKLMSNNAIIYSVKVVRKYIMSSNKPSTQFTPCSMQQYESKFCRGSSEEFESSIFSFIPYHKSQLPKDPAFDVFPADKYGAIDSCLTMFRPWWS